MRPASDDGIVVEEVEKGDVHMLVNDVPAPLGERLGPEGTNGLLEILERIRDESVAATMTACADRFERRLIETSSALRLEIAGLRQETHDGFAALRKEMREGDTVLRQEMREGDTALRQEMHAGFAVLRQEMRDGDAALKQEMHAGFAVLRQEVRDGDAALKQEVHGGLAAVRQDLALQRAEQLKWSFLFWVGQVAVVAGLFGILLRAVA